MLRREVYKPGEPHSGVWFTTTRQLALLALSLAAGFYGVILALCGCNSALGEVKDIGADFAEVTYCEFETCGQVFLCTMPDGTKNEWCWMDDQPNELRDASGALMCVPTPRGGALGWPCLYCTKGRGNNAYGGSFGCEGQ